MKKRISILTLIVAVLLIILAVAFRYIHSTQNVPPPISPMRVITADVIAKNAPLYIKTQGSVEASRSVAIQPQVTGIIKKIGFTPGQYVKAGQLLFEIDSATYQAALIKAQANLAKDQAQLQMIQKDKTRYQSLVKKNFVSKQQYDQIKTQVEEQLSVIKLDQAAISQSQTELNYAHIQAPISGKTGNVTIKEGDLVNTSSAKTLVTINQLTPIFVDFYLPQSNISLLMKYKEKHPLTVTVYIGGQKQPLDTGTVAFIDNTVNTSTGTILLKASMPNKNKLLWPGESVIVKLIFTVEKNALAVPSQAVQSDQKGNFVYLIKNKQAIITPVKVLRQVGQWTFIREGLQQGDQVATVFPPNLQNKSPVIVSASTSE